MLNAVCTYVRISNTVGDILNPKDQIDHGVLATFKFTFSIFDFVFDILHRAREEPENKLLSKACFT